MRCRYRLIHAPLVAVATCSLLAAGCDAGGSPGVASVSSSTIAVTTTTQNGQTTQSGTLASALAFARCMRSHDIPNWPDPTSGGVFDKSKLQQLGLRVSRVRALEAGACDIPLPSGGQPQEQMITAADRADYREGAVCMRRHGFPGFPDPTFQNNNVMFNIPSSIGTDSSQFKRTKATCQTLIPAGLPDSGSSAP